MAGDAGLIIIEHNDNSGSETDDRSSAAEVLACIARYGSAHIEVDIPALEALLAEDYQHFHASGRIDDKKTLLDRLRCGAVKHVKKETSFVTLKIHGATAILSGQGRHTVIMNGSTKLVENLFTTVWVRSASGEWRITSWTAAPVTALSIFPSVSASAMNDWHKASES